MPRPKQTCHVQRICDLALNTKLCFLQDLAGISVKCHEHTCSGMILSKPIRITPQQLNATCTLLALATFRSIAPHPLTILPSIPWSKRPLCSSVAAGSLGAPSAALASAVGQSPGHKALRQMFYNSLHETSSISVAELVAAMNFRLHETKSCGKNMTTGSKPPDIYIYIY